MSQVEVSRLSQPKSRAKAFVEAASALALAFAIAFSIKGKLAPSPEPQGGFHPRPPQGEAGMSPRGGRGPDSAQAPSPEQREVIRARAQECFEKYGEKFPPEDEPSDEVKLCLKSAGVPPRNPRPGAEAQGR